MSNEIFWEKQEERNGNKVDFETAMTELVKIPLNQKREYIFIEFGTIRELFNELNYQGSKGWMLWGQMTILDSPVIVMERAIGR